ncbi:FAD-binding oxidoreductase [uncultured Nevskia sp.]|uniref:FAD-binding oxidoreductase n=1 Tax=uncultured Nevskia sp. TaxID=228950 RepID=UPI0025E73270|nr:FAD-binding oxidoreductase [uncultured Nevskia sp.]
MSRQAFSWGRLPAPEQRLIKLASRFDALPTTTESLLPYGLGRSYGDSCLNSGGVLVGTRGLDRYIAFDRDSGVIEVEAGVSLGEIIELTLPQGWFPAALPGTRFVTVGGAIANDVHGKNHHRAGSFGHHLLGFELLRSDGQALHCSPTANAELFAATIGGLGLTGLIRRASLQLQRVPGPWISGSSERFGSLAEFFALSAEAETASAYTVAWIDSSATGANTGRGIFIRGNHAEGPNSTATPKGIRLPITPPQSLINPLTLAAFNALYYWRPAAVARDALWHWQPFFHPLDAVQEWNRIYGPRGFYQYQCVVPMQDAETVIGEMLQRIAESRLGSFLVVLKTFGSMAARGMMSFPRPGATLAIDFPNRGAPTLALLDALDALTMAADGAVYPAKDARMSPTAFRQYFPQWQAFARHVDPRFSSSFWRRVTETEVT